MNKLEEFLFLIWIQNVKTISLTWRGVKEDTVCTESESWVAFGRVNKGGKTLSQNLLPLSIICSAAGGSPWGFRRSVRFGSAELPADTLCAAQAQPRLLMIRTRALGGFIQSLGLVWDGALARPRTKHWVLAGLALGGAGGGEGWAGCDGLCQDCQRGHLYWTCLNSA